MSTLREYFLLTDATATAKRIPEGDRKQLERQLRAARQRAQAADALWANGHTAEGLRLIAEAFSATLGAASRFAQALGLEDEATPVVVPRPAPAVLSSGTADAPTEDSDAPTEDSDAPAEDNDAPDEDNDAPAEGTDAPDEDNDAPDEDNDAPAEGTDAPDEDNDAPDEDNDAPDEDNDAPDEDNDAPDEDNDAPAEGTDAPDEDNDAPDEDNDAPAESDLEQATPQASRAVGAWRAALASRGVVGTRLSDVASAHEHLDGLALPALDDDVSSKEGALFQELVSARNVVDHALNPATLTPGALMRARLTRIGGALALTTAVLVGAAVLLWPTTVESAFASTRYNAQFPASNVIDDDPDSEWLLPDGETGWVEVRLTPPARVNTVRLRNAHNRNHNDRATQAYTIEFYVDGAVAETVEAEWPRLEARPPWTEHAAGIDDVERIRVNVVSHHELGAGLAELEWD